MPAYLSLEFSFDLLAFGDPTISSDLMPSGASDDNEPPLSSLSLENFNCSKQGKEGSIIIIMLLVHD